MQICHLDFIIEDDSLSGGNMPVQLSSLSRSSVHVPTFAQPFLPRLMSTIFFAVSLCLASSVISLLISLGGSSVSEAGVESSITGQVLDEDMVAMPGATVKLLATDGKLIKETLSDGAGGFVFFPVEFGTYDLLAVKTDYTESRVTVAVTSSATVELELHLKSARSQKEIVVNVKEKRRLVQPAVSASKTQIDRSRIESMPGGNQATLPQVISSTTPGVVQGPFGQLFIRGNHANIQYQVDGVQLPESTSGSFGEALSARNVEKMEVITGDVPAEFGERLAAVVNIVTKSGPEKPGGQAEVRYGTYNTIQPQASYGGSDASGRLRYFLSGSFMQTDRGLDTPDPASYDDQSHGGKNPVHDKAVTSDEFVRLDYVLDNSDKFSLNLFNSNRVYQIPNYPASFKSSDPYFNVGYLDSFGNGSKDVTLPPNYNWVPSTTDDTQGEQNTYVELVWKKTVSDRSFLQVAPYLKRSRLTFSADQANDLITLNPSSPYFINNSQADSFSLTHPVDNYGVKSDFTWRADDANLWKGGFQIQRSVGTGSFSLTDSTLTTRFYQINDTGYTEAVYLQDTYSIIKPLTLNAGIRYSAVQFNSDQLTTQDGLLQPRIGLDYLLSEATKLHIFYGKLFQPAPFENLRQTFINQGGGSSSSPYDLKAEKDDYYEVGITHHLGDQNLLSLVGFYKDAVDMLDDAQLLYTSIAQPYNLAKGYATGIELSFSGDVAPHWQHFFNYSYEDARGKGLSGGTFASQKSAPDYQFLDHCQLNTANAGVTYKASSHWVTVSGLYGSGLRTGPNNSISLPSHTTFDATVGTTFTGEEWWSKWRLSGDLTNVFDNPYPITVSNGFNGSHYAPGRQFFIHLAKDI